MKNFFFAEQRLIGFTGEAKPDESSQLKKDPFAPETGEMKKEDKEKDEAIGSNRNEEIAHGKKKLEGVTDRYKKLSQQFSTFNVDGKANNAFQEKFREIDAAIKEVPARLETNHKETIEKIDAMLAEIDVFLNTLNKGTTKRLNKIPSLQPAPQKGADAIRPNAKGTPAATPAAPKAKPTTDYEEPTTKAPDAAESEQSTLIGYEKAMPKPFEVNKEPTKPAKQTEQAPEADKNSDIKSAMDNLVFFLGAHEFDDNAKSALDQLNAGLEKRKLLDGKSKALASVGLMKEGNDVDGRLMRTPKTRIVENPNSGSKYEIGTDIDSTKVWVAEVKQEGAKPKSAPNTVPNTINPLFALRKTTVNAARLIATLEKEVQSTSNPMDPALVAKMKQALAAYCEAGLKEWGALKNQVKDRDEGRMKELETDVLIKKGRLIVLNSTFPDIAPADLASNAPSLPATPEPKPAGKPESNQPSAEPVAPASSQNAPTAAKEQSEKTDESPSSGLRRPKDVITDSFPKNPEAFVKRMEELQEKIWKMQGEKMEARKTRNDVKVRDIGHDLSALTKEYSMMNQAFRKNTGMSFERWKSDDSEYNQAIADRKRLEKTGAFSSERFKKAMAAMNPVVPQDAPSTPDANPKTTPDAPSGAPQAKADAKTTPNTPKAAPKGTAPDTPDVPKATPKDKKTDTPDKPQEAPKTKGQALGREMKAALQKMEKAETKDEKWEALLELLAAAFKYLDALIHGRLNDAHDSKNAPKDTPEQLKSKEVHARIAGELKARRDGKPLDAQLTDMETEKKKELAITENDLKKNKTDTEEGEKKGTELVAQKTALETERKSMKSDDPKAAALDAKIKEFGEQIVLNQEAVKKLKERRPVLLKQEERLTEDLKAVKEISEGVATVLKTLKAGLEFLLKEKAFDSYALKLSPEGNIMVSFENPTAGFSEKVQAIGGKEEGTAVIIDISKVDTGKLALPVKNAPGARKEEPEDKIEAPADAKNLTVQEMGKVLKDTWTVLNGKIERTMANILEAKKDLDEVKASGNWFRKGWVSNEIKTKETNFTKSTDALAKLNQYKAKISQYVDPSGEIKKDLKLDEKKVAEINDVRKQLGLPALPRNMVADYKAFQEEAIAKHKGRDREIEVDYAALNKSLQESEKVLHEIQVWVERADTAAAIGASIAVPVWGAGTYAAVRNLMDVYATGAKQKEEALADFALMSFAGLVGGAASGVTSKGVVSLGKLAPGAQKTVMAWAQKNAASLSMRAAQTFLEYGSKAGLGAVSGATMAGVDSGARNAYDVSHGRKTEEQAWEETKSAVKSGALTGALMGGAMHGVGKVANPAWEKTKAGMKKGVEKVKAKIKSKGKPKEENPPKDDESGGTAKPTDTPPDTPPSSPTSTPETPEASAGAAPKKEAPKAAPTAPAASPSVWKEGENFALFPGITLKDASGKPLPHGDYKILQSSNFTPPGKRVLNYRDGTPAGKTIIVNESDLSQIPKTPAAPPPPAMKNAPKAAPTAAPSKPSEWKANDGFAIYKGNSLKTADGRTLANGDYRVEPRTPSTPAGETIVSRSDAGRTGERIEFSVRTEDLARMPKTPAAPPPPAMKNAPKTAFKSEGENKLDQLVAQEKQLRAEVDKYKPGTSNPSLEKKLEDVRSDIKFLRGIKAAGRAQVEQILSSPSASFSQIEDNMITYLAFHENPNIALLQKHIPTFTSRLKELETTLLPKSNPLTKDGVILAAEAQHLPSLILKMQEIIANGIKHGN